MLGLMTKHIKFIMPIAQMIFVFIKRGKAMDKFMNLLRKLKL